MKTEEPRIIARCPECKQKIEICGEMTGDPVACPNCGTRIVPNKTRTVQEEFPPIMSMGTLGAFLFVLGFLGMLFFFFIYSTVAGAVNNIGLLNTRECGMIGSAALTIFGGMFFVADVIRDTLKK